MARPDSRERGGRECGSASSRRKRSSRRCGKPKAPRWWSTICRKLGVTETAFYRWKNQYTGLDVSELRGLKQLRDENRRLKQVVVDLTLDKTMLR